jgi:predicted AAA+ superfamily ATPase
MINRFKRHEIHQLLEYFPAVAILGPRQVGKTTLAHEVANAQISVYLDLESEFDRS